MASGLLLQAQRSVTRTRGDGGRVTTTTYPGDGTIAFTPGISERKSSATRMMHGDYLGSIVRQTGSAGTSQYGARYDAFGATYATSGTSWGPFGFAGQWGYQTDADSGLMLLGHRYYDSSTGRFLSRDPIKDGRNWYGYCDSNPLKGIDPEGLAWYYNNDTGELSCFPGPGRNYHEFPKSNPPNKIGRPVPVGKGFSGKRGPWRDNPDYQYARGRGPIPVGKWFIGPRRSVKSDGTPLDNLVLTPAPGTVLKGRSAFLIHGGSYAGDPSEGCIILPKDVRDQIWNSGDRELIVWN